MSARSPPPFRRLAGAGRDPHRRCVHGCRGDRGRSPEPGRAGRYRGGAHRGLHWADGRADGLYVLNWSRLVRRRKASQQARCGHHGRSFDFPESVLLAEIYGKALAANKFPVRILPGLGPRELVGPALMNGLLQLVPEYAGSALEFISLGHLPPIADAAMANKALAKSVAGRGLLAARPAAAQ